MFGWRRYPRSLASAGASLVAACLVVLPACTSGGNPQAGPSSSKAPAGPKITSITATPVNADEIDLQWVVSGDPFGYSVTRDGTYLSRIDGTSYKDTDVKPKQTYTYQVDIQDSSGSYTPGASASATTPKQPPLSKARLSGSYGVRFVFTAENYVNRSVGNKYSERWKLKPKCATGACSTVLVTNAPGAKPGVLTLKGGTYHGSVTDTLATCQGTHYKETKTVTLHVTRGKFLHGEWTATTFSGTSSDYSPPALGCQSGSSKSSLSGKRL
jgi:hypothetical protein